MKERREVSRWYLQGLSASSMGEYKKWQELKKMASKRWDESVNLEHLRKCGTRLILLGELESK